MNNTVYAKNGKIRYEGTDTVIGPFRFTEFLVEDTSEQFMEKFAERIAANWNEKLSAGESHGDLLVDLKSQMRRAGGSDDVAAALSEIWN
jgi:hypothetical protein